MTGRTYTERLLDAYLAPEADRLPDRVIDATLDEIARTPQRRALRVPWRFPLMPAISRTTGVAAALLVAVVGAGAVLYLNVPGGASPTTGPTAAASLPPGIPGWTPYTSAVYGFTMAYPSDWSIYQPASQEWPAGQDVTDGAPYADVFVSPGEPEIGLLVWEIRAPAGVNLGSPAGLGASLPALCESIRAESCQPVFAPTEMCLGPLGLVEPDPGQQECRPVLIASLGERDAEIPHAFVGDPDARTVIVFVAARPEGYPAAEKYGGSRTLLMAIVSHLEDR